MSAPVLGNPLAARTRMVTFGRFHVTELVHAAQLVKESKCLLRAEDGSAEMYSLRLHPVSIMREPILLTNDFELPHVTGTWRDG